MLPAMYSWLNTITPPNIIKEALKLYGVDEVLGKQNNPEILSWGRECNISYNADSIPWCGLFVAVVVKRANWTIVDNPLWARNWMNFGVPSPSPGLGDIMIFSRNGGGHVGFYIGEDLQYYHVLGGNQGDSVNIIRINKDRLIGARRPKWRISKPASVKRYTLGASGIISQDEA